MLDRKHLKYNLTIFAILSKLSILLVEFDTKTGKMHLTRSPWKRFAGLFWKMYIIAYLVYVNGASLRTIWNSEENNLAYIIFSLICSSIFTGCTVSCWIVMSDQYVGINVKLFNEFFKKIGEDSQEERMKKKKIVPEELLIRFMPMFWYPCLTVFPLLYAVDPNLPILFIAAVDPVNRTVPIFIICLMLQEVAMFLVLTYVYFVGFFVLSFILTMEENIQRQILIQQEQGAGFGTGSDSEFGDEIPVEKVLDILKLQMSLFNLTFKKIIFMLKQNTLGAAILGGFGAIRFAHTSPYFALVFFVFQVQGFAVFIGLFNRAFQIGPLMEDYKSSIVLGSHRIERIRVSSSFPKMERLGSKIGTREVGHFQIVPDRQKQEELSRTVSAIPQFGIKVGGFQYLERESTLIFLGFVVDQTVGLLLTF